LTAFDGRHKVWLEANDRFVLGDGVELRQG
jgi:hypothetical protein